MVRVNEREVEIPIAEQRSRFLGRVEKQPDSVGMPLCHSGGEEAPVAIQNLVETRLALDEVRVYANVLCQWQRLP